MKNILILMLMAYGTYVYYSDAVVYMGEDRVQAYEISGQLAVRVESLTPLGFLAKWDSREWTYRLNDMRLAPHWDPRGGTLSYWGERGWNRRHYSHDDILPLVNNGVAGTLVPSDIRFVLNGIDIPAYSIGGSSFFLLDDIAANTYILEMHGDAIHIVATRYNTWQSDIGPVDTYRLTMMHSPMNIPFRLVSFVPTVDGVPLDTSFPYGINPGGPSSGWPPHFPHMFVPLAATLDALGLGFEWDYESGVFRVNNDGVSFGEFQGEVPDFLEVIDAHAVRMDIYGIEMYRSPLLYDGIVYVDIRDIAAIIGWDAGTRDIIRRRPLPHARDTEFGPIRHAVMDYAFNDNHFFELMDYNISVQGDTFLDQSPSFTTQAILVTNKENGEESMYIPMASAGARLSPNIEMFGFAGVRTGPRVGSPGNFISFTVDAPMGIGYEAVRAMFMVDGADIHISPIGTGVEIMEIGTAHLRFDLPGASSFAATGRYVYHSHTQILIYGDHIFVPVDFLAALFGYNLHQP